MSAKHVALDRSVGPRGGIRMPYRLRSEEHTSELQSQSNLVCRLLLEKKKTQRCLRSFICGFFLFALRVCLPLVEYRAIWETVSHDHSRYRVTELTLSVA